MTDPMRTYHDARLISRLHTEQVPGARRPKGLAGNSKDTPPHPRSQYTAVTGTGSRGQVTPCGWPTQRRQHRQGAGGEPHTVSTPPTPAGSRARVASEHSETTWAPQLANITPTWPTGGSRALRTCSWSLGSPTSASQTL